MMRACRLAIPRLRWRSPVNTEIPRITEIPHVSHVRNFPDQRNYRLPGRGKGGNRVGVTAVPPHLREPPSLTAHPPPPARTSNPLPAAQPRITA